MVKHVEHVREVAGVDHVGLGGDYDGVASCPRVSRTSPAIPRLLAALADRGWSDDDLGKLTSGNILRVMRDAEEGARALQAAARARAWPPSPDLDGEPARPERPEPSRRGLSCASA